ncbi:hypothetical protein SODG_002427 [Sodalis praecaptivus]
MFAISYCVNVLSLSSQVILYGILLACLLECFTLPLFGHLADRYGKKRVYLAGMIAQALLAWPFMLMLASGHLGLIYLAIVLGLGLGHGSTFGAQGLFLRAVPGADTLQRLISGTANRAHPGRRSVADDRHGAAGGAAQ